MGKKRRDGIQSMKKGKTGLLVSLIVESNTIRAWGGTQGVTCLFSIFWMWWYYL